MNQNRHKLAAAIVCAQLAMPAIAQSGGALEEIIVTAQKREQSLQDVPVAVSAFTGEQLQEAVIKDVFDLQTNTPGLVVGQSQNNTTSNFSIRGVGTSSQNYGLESSVGLYVDGVYRSRQSTMINDMVDIESVEVLRGPQGTLFGKNTPSGAVLFRTKAPSHEQDSAVTMTAGNYGLFNTSAAGNLTLIEDELAVRGTVFSSKRDGFVDVDGFGDEEANDRDRWGVRLQALWEPNEDLSVRVIADYSKIDEICCAAQTFKSSVTASDRTNGGAPIPGSDAILQALGGTVFEGDQTDQFRTALNSLPESESTDRGISLDVQWDRGDYVFNSITSYRKYDSRDKIDSDFSDVEILTTENDATMDSFSQEFRIDYSSDDVNAVVGLYYFEQEVELDYSLFGGDQLADYVGAGFGLNTLTAGINSISGFTGVTAADPLPDNFNALHNALQDQSSWALFGQVDYNLREDLVLTAGLRYTEEEKDLSTVYSETINGAPWAAGGVPNVAGATAALTAAAGGDFSLLGTVDWTPFGAQGWGGYLFDAYFPRSDINAKIDDEQITGTIKLSWFYSEDSMVYAAFGTGYKSGGTNTDRINQAFNPVFDAETSKSLEVGLKSEFPDQAMRVNVALHYTTVDDYQANAWSGTGFNLQNAGSLETYGGELELLWQPAELTTVNLAYAYSHAEYEEFEAGNCWVAYTFHTGTADPGANGDGSCDRSGDELQTNPEHFLNLGIKQEFNIADGVSGYLYGEYNYRSEQVLDGNADPYKQEDGYGLLNLRGAVMFEEMDMTLTLWGRNVLDEEYKRTTFDVPIQTGKLMSYVSEPRTFGITLNKNF